MLLNCLFYIFLWFMFIILANNNNYPVLFVFFTHKNQAGGNALPPARFV